MVGRSSLRKVTGCWWSVTSKISALLSVSQANWPADDCSLCTVQQCSVVLSPYMLVSPTHPLNVRKGFIQLEKCLCKKFSHATTLYFLTSYTLLSFCFQLYSSYRYLSLECQKRNSLHCVTVNHMPLSFCFSLLVFSLEVFFLLLFLSVSPSPWVSLERGSKEKET